MRIATTSNQRVIAGFAIEILKGSAAAEQAVSTEVANQILVISIAADQRIIAGTAKETLANADAAN